MKVEREKIGTENYLKVELSQLEKGSIRIERELPLEWLERRMTFCEYEVRPKNARVRLNVEGMTNGVLVRGNVITVVGAQCGMCLKDININIEGTVSTFMMPQEERAKLADDMEFTPEDLDKEYYDGDIIYLDGLIGDAIMLEMPMNPKCGSSCPGFGSAVSEIQTPEIDPRLAPLAGIRLDKEN